VGLQLPSRRVFFSRTSKKVKNILKLSENEIEK
jgi:hypothetical protein